MQNVNMISLGGTSVADYNQTMQSAMEKRGLTQQQLMQAPLSPRAQALREHVQNEMVHRTPLKDRLTGLLNDAELPQQIQSGYKRLITRIETLADTAAEMLVSPKSGENYQRSFSEQLEAISNIASDTSERLAAFEAEFDARAMENQRKWEKEALDNPPRAPKLD